MRKSMKQKIAPSKKINKIDKTLERDKDKERADTTPHQE